MGTQPRSGPLRRRWGTLFVLVALLVCAVGAAAHATQPPPVKRVHHPSGSALRILPRHTVGSNGLVKRSTIVPPPHSLRHDDTLMLTASLPSLLPYDVHLLLSPTENLFSAKSKIVSQDENGEEYTEPLRAEDWRLYSGDVIRPSWAERSWEQERIGMGRNADAVIGRAAVMVHKYKDGQIEWEGTFDIGGEEYNVLTRKNYNIHRTAEDVEVAELDGDMVVFTHKDLAHDKRSNTGGGTSCGSDKLAYNNDPYHPARRRSDIPSHLFGLFPRSDDMGGGNTPDTNYINNIGSTTGCHAEQRILYMGVMLDCNYVLKHNSVAEARTNILNQWNKVTNLYMTTFKISLGIVELADKGSTCPPRASSTNNEDWNVACDTSVNLDTRLGAFSRWRGDRSDDGIGLWHLMTACQTGTEVGVAWLGAICTTGVTHQDDGTYVSGTGVSSAHMTEWNVIAHEIGHGFGAIHDCQEGCSLTGRCCPYTKTSCDAGGKYVMNPTTAPTEQKFSPCSIGNICTYTASSNKQCLFPADSNTRTLISLNNCGNGVVEGDEECDPGMNSNSTCCDATTCKFRSGAVCDPSNGVCCTDQCQFAKQGVTCRASLNAKCDTAEVCTGTQAACPKDETAKDGTNCGDGLQCASGQCTSLDQQCKTAGSSQGLSKACGQKNDKTCVVSCKDPSDSRVCQILQAVLIDGSPCGYGGRCYNATCKAGSWQEQLNAMYTQNLQISVPVTVAVGIVILAILYQLIRCCCVRRPKKNAARSAAVPVAARPPPPLATASYSGGYQQLGEMTPQGHRSTNQIGRLSDDNSQSNLYDPAGPTPMTQTYSDPYSRGPDYNQGYTGGYANEYPANHTQGFSHPQDSWVDPHQYNGPGYGQRQ